MTVYVLAELPAYETGSVIGVFSTEDKANAALEEFLAREHGPHTGEVLMREFRSYLKVLPMTLDELPSYDFGESFVRYVVYE